MAGAAILIVGSLAFHNGWPHTSGHAWPQPSTGPGGPAAFMWVATLSVSAYWAHPTILLNLPASEVAWMAVNALALDPVCRRSGQDRPPTRPVHPTSAIRDQRQRGSDSRAGALPAGNARLAHRRRPRTRSPIPSRHRRPARTGRHDSLPHRGDPDCSNNPHLTRPGRSGGPFQSANRSQPPPPPRRAGGDRRGPHGPFGLVDPPVAPKADK